MRGYFAVGTDGISKPMNLGNLLRIAHAFGASFFFTVAGRVKLADAMSDTSDAAGHLPLYQFPAIDDLRLPQGCELVGVEITEDAVRAAELSPSIAGCLCLWLGAILALSGGARALSLCREDSRPAFPSMSGWRVRLCSTTVCCRCRIMASGRCGRAGRQNRPFRLG